MAVIVIPAAVGLSIAGQTYGQARFDMDDSSDATGGAFTNLYGPPRWTSRLASKAALPLDVGGAWEAMLLQLRGRVNHLAVYDYLRPLALGTARGSSVIAAAGVAIGDTSVQVANARPAGNMLTNSSYEVDTNADGTADAWATYAAGTSGTVTLSRIGSGAVFGTYKQRVSAPTLGGTTADRAGIEQTVPVVAGTQYTLSVWLGNPSGSVSAGLMVRYADGGGGFLSNPTDFAITPAGAMTRYSLTTTAPVGAATATVRLLIHSRLSGSPTLDFDGAQFEPAATASTWQGDCTYLPGDWLQIGTGVGSHLAKCTTAVTLANGGGSIAFEPPARVAYASSSAVAVERALGHYKMLTPGLTWQARANGPALEGFTVDLMEQWA